MKYIANIITKNKIDVSEYINVAKDITEVDLRLPTLIIGWDNVKNIYPNANILDKKISENIFWTYSNREKRQEYEPDLAKFVKNVFDNLENNVKYIFFNVLTSRLKKIKGLITYVNSPFKKIIYVTEKNIYVYDYKLVIGISLSDLEYYGLNRDRILKYLTKNPYNTLFYDNSFLSWKLKRVIGDNHKVIPYLYSLKQDF